MLFQHFEVGTLADTETGHRHIAVGTIQRDTISTRGGDGFKATSQSIQRYCEPQVARGSLPIWKTIHHSCDGSRNVIYLASFPGPTRVHNE